MDIQPRFGGDGKINFCFGYKIEIEIMDSIFCFNTVFPTNDIMI